MARVLLFVLGTILTGLVVPTSLHDERILDTQAEGIPSNNSNFIPFKAQLQYASVAQQNNGMVQYVIKVLDADDTECIFMADHIHDDALVNDVMTKGEVITGISLLQRTPSWLLFTCASLTSPVVAQYLFNMDIPAKVTTQMELRNTYRCKISEPVFSSKENMCIVEVQATCSFELTGNNSFLQLEGTFLTEGNISHLLSEDNYNTTRTYENGVAKAIFVSSNLVPPNSIFVPWFSLALSGMGDEKPIISQKHSFLSPKAFDGSSEIIPEGRVAIAIYPPYMDTIYVKRGSTAKIACGAYGNPDPVVTWSTNGQVLEGKNELTNVKWDKYHQYQSLIIEDMGTVNDGEYVCQAQVLGNVVTKSVNIKTCDPASVHLSTTKDDNFVNITLSAIQDETNKIEKVDCYRDQRKKYDTLIDEYNSLVNIDVTENSTMLELKYYWKMSDKGDVPGYMYCKFQTSCVIHPMTFRLNV